MNAPTPYPEVNRLLHELLENVQAVLGSCFVGLYLDGSLTGPDFDQDSDVDFVAVTNEEISAELFSALQSMHDRLAAIDSPFADQLEGSYLSQRALRRYDPAYTCYPNIERGQGERLKWVHHTETWDVHRSVLRERGIPLAGPALATLIDPVSADQLRRAMQVILSGWAASILADPALMRSRGYQSYTVLSMCRILYTLEKGAVVSKRAAAGWVEETLGERWRPLIENARVGRHNPNSESSPEEVAGTLGMIRYAMECGQQFEIAPDS